MSSANTSVSTVLFDFGGVISESPFDGFARYEADNGLPDGLIRQINSSNPDDNAWAGYERGELSLDAFADAFAAEGAALGHVVDAHQVLACLHPPLREAMVEAVQQLRASPVRTALLTNNLEPIDISTDPIYDNFEVVVQSSVVGVRKPEPRFYEIACELMGVTPAECVFLDDLGINLKPAKAMGMTTIKVTSGEQALADLRAVIDW